MCDSVKHRLREDFPGQLCAGWLCNITDDLNIIWGYRRQEVQPKIDFLKLLARSSSTLRAHLSVHVDIELYPNRL